MNIPATVSKTTLQSLFSDKDTHAVRVILHDVNNSGVARFRCRLRTYLFERNGQVGKHALDIPISVWMFGATGSRHEQERSVCNDFRTSKTIPYSIQVVPIRDSELRIPPTLEEQAVPLLRKLLSTLGAPDPVVEAFRHIEAGDIESLQTLVAKVEAPETPRGEAETAKKKATAERMKKMREAKAKKKAVARKP